MAENRNTQASVSVSQSSNMPLVVLVKSTNNYVSTDLEPQDTKTGTASTKK